MTCSSANDGNVNSTTTRHHRSAHPHRKGNFPRLGSAVAVRWFCPLTAPRRGHLNADWGARALDETRYRQAL